MPDISEDKKSLLSYALKASAENFQRAIKMANGTNSPNDKETFKKRDASIRKVLSKINKT